MERQIAALALSRIALLIASSIVDCATRPVARTLPRNLPAVARLR
jgi:hypothetical protein